MKDMFHVLHIYIYILLSGSFRSQLNKIEKINNQNKSLSLEAVHQIKHKTIIHSSQSEEEDGGNKES